MNPSPDKYNFKYEKTETEVFAFPLSEDPMSVDHLNEMIRSASSGWDEDLFFTVEDFGFQEHLIIRRVRHIR